MSFNTCFENITHVNMMLTQLQKVMLPHKTYFRPIRDNEPRVYTVGKLSPRDSSSESVGPHTTPIKRSNSKLTNVVSETNINVIMYYVIFYYIILFYYFETFHEYNTMFSCILTLSFILNLI